MAADLKKLETSLGSGNYRRIARMTGIDTIHVSRVLRGLREPSFDVAAIIAEAAGVSLDELKEYTYQFRTPRTAAPRYDDADSGF